MSVYRSDATKVFVAELRNVLARTQTPNRLGCLILGELFIIAEDFSSIDATFPANTILSSLQDVHGHLWKKGFFSSSIACDTGEREVRIIPDHTINLSPSTLVYRIVSSRQTYS